MTANAYPANLALTHKLKIIDALVKAETLLRSSGVTETPRLEAEALLADMLGIDRIKLTASYTLAIENPSAYFSLIRRRVAGEPFAYITGKKEFMSFTFGIDDSALIPRPETETLVEHVVETIGKAAAATIVDIGTGCGCIAISLALIMPLSLLHATDICPGALSLARRNAEHLGVDDRISFHVGDLYSALPDHLKGRADALVSNPPYISDSEYATLEAGVRDFEPAIALRGSTDGLDVFRKIVAGAREYLAPGGILAIEIGVDQSEVAETILKRTEAFSDIGTVKDLAGRPRVLTGRRAQ